MSVIIYEKNKREIVRVKGSDFNEREKTHNRIQEMFDSDMYPNAVIVGRRLDTTSKESKQTLKDLSTKFDFEIRSADRLLRKSYFLVKRKISKQNYQQIANN